MTDHADATAWEHALRDLERELDRAEALLANDPAATASAQSWTPPTGLGPLPAHLEQAGRALLARQHEVSQRLADAAHHSRRHDRALSQLAHDGPRPPVYVDTPA